MSAPHYPDNGEWKAIYTGNNKTEEDHDKAFYTLFDDTKDCDVHFENRAGTGLFMVCVWFRYSSTENYQLLKQLVSDQRGHINARFAQKPIMKFTLIQVTDEPIEIHGGVYKDVG